MRNPDRSFAQRQIPFKIAEQPLKIVRFPQKSACGLDEPVDGRRREIKISGQVIEKVAFQGLP